MNSHREPVTIRCFTLCFCLFLLAFNGFGQAEELDSLIVTDINLGDTLGSTQADTSDFMGTLNRINTFMEWYVKYFPVPYGSYSKETNWLVGLSKYNAFTIRHGDKTDTITQPSSLSLFGYYTGNDQYKIVLESNLMFNKNRGLWRTAFIYTYFPLDYFGVGNNTSFDDERTLNTANFQFRTEYLFKTYKKWFIGPSYDYLNFYEVSLAPGSSALPSDSIYLTNNVGKQSGIGVKVLMEGRDNRLNAKKGFYVESNFQIFDEAIGSQFNYTLFHADVRNYFSPNPKLTIATQVQTQYISGKVPVQSLSFLGGDYTLRGIYRGRYRDNVSFDMQTELRFPVFWIIGATVFGGIGQVAPEYQQMQMNEFHLAYGAGLRLKVDSENDVNLRFDVGHSKDQTLIIVNFSEAF